MEMKMKMKTKMKVEVQWKRKEEKGRSTLVHWLIRSQYDVSASPEQSLSLI
jgi:hypothetical protein